MFLHFLLFCVILVTLLLFRTVYVLYNIRQKRNTNFSTQNKKKVPSKTLIIIGSGGHTSEILRLTEVLGDQYSPRCYVIAQTDEMSEAKVHKAEKNRLKNEKQSKYQISYIPRSREVKQNWLSTIFSTIYAFLYSFPLVIWQCPDLVLCNGPGTCIPICLAAFLITVCGVKKANIVYVESICRVETLSLSGKMLYHLADHMLVQWPQLKDKYPLTSFIGRIV